MFCVGEQGNLKTYSIVGFDSAWTDKPSAPGAVSIVRVHGTQRSFQEPQLASFDQALETIHAERDASDVCLVALDQPTIVPNLTSLRPVDRVAASVISWAGGGVQPANRSKMGMFDDAAPIWHFKQDLGAIEDPERVREADQGLYLIEVFPALALLSIEERFFSRLQAPRYNPARRRTFRPEDWLAVLNAVARHARLLELEDMATWCGKQRFHTPRKADQDRLDSVICALVGFTWILRSRNSSVMLGDTMSGYMITPVSESLRQQLQVASLKFGVPIT